MATQAFKSKILLKTPKWPRDDVILNNFWKDGKVLVKLFRRFGCPLCRYEAHVLSKYEKVFSDLGIKLVGVGFDEDGLDEWLENKYWNFDLFMDPKHALYNGVKTNRLSVFQGIVSVLSPSNKPSARVAAKNGLGGNLLIGDGFQLGGTFLIGPGGEVLYEFLQTGYSDYPSLRAIVQAAGGDPMLIDEEDEKLAGAPVACKL
ncbi:hypothetical protein CONCODRAFT_80257 [Conidiobolus coronatus NRRL 28638]|uniref:Thioredoxin domain-containing protein n=1 Tax=Conidiobolus coronatus (strain ATCC 28846 / CBS 209.66 / NRRL 28638) TaxID=796925 RepID=A0A137NWI6_CONC2|nr:hypothetical protein CONCODRAFT_80257 [Conidiobolus coronatus NRRL 28638]|eukprot:KXN67173.1 hypothetical protein CONCODRAFT_80257 [Conidiobolus coronatus NRRL 28638]